MTEPWIVDTNVGIVANDRLDDGLRTFECIASCRTFIGTVMKTGSVAVDADWEIIAEYKHRMRSSGEPGLGDAFLKWVLTNQANPDRCQFVDIRETEIPAVLSDFDPSDRKFIKVALELPEAPIAQAVDSLWWKRRADFVSAALKVEYLCQAEIQVLSDRKHGPDW